MNINTEKAADKNAIRPFHVNNVPEEELTELRRRINATRWPEKGTMTPITSVATACAETSPKFTGISPENA